MLCSELVGEPLELGPGARCAPEPPTECAGAGRVDSHDADARRETTREIRSEKSASDPSAHPSDHDHPCRAPRRLRKSGDHEWPKRRWFTGRGDRGCVVAECGGERALRFARDRDARDRGLEGSCGGTCRRVAEIYEDQIGPASFTRLQPQSRGRDAQVVAAADRGAAGPASTDRPPAERRSGTSSIPPPRAIAIALAPSSSSSRTIPRSSVAITRAAYATGTAEARPP